MSPAGVLDVLGLTDALVGWMRAAALERAAFLGNSFGCQILADLTVHYHTEMKKIPLRFPMPDPLSLDRLETYLEQTRDRYPVRWL